MRAGVKGAGLQRPRPTTCLCLDSSPSPCPTSSPDLPFAWGGEGATDASSGPGVSSLKETRRLGYGSGAGVSSLPPTPVLTLLFQVVGRGLGSSIINMII